MEEPARPASAPRPWEYGLVVLIAVAFTVAGSMRMNDLSLYTDSTRYLIWANSLAEGNGFLDPTTPEPSRFVMNAPLYPVLLVPSQLASPWSLGAAKAWTLLWGAVALILLFIWVRRSFPAGPSLWAAAFLGLHPLFFVVSTEVLSEAPFMALLLAALLAIDPLLRSAPLPRRAMGAAALLILLPLLREVAFAFALAASAVLLNKGQIRRAALLAIGAALLVIGWNLRNAFFAGTLQAGQEANVEFLFGHFVTPQAASLASEFVTRLWLNTKGYLATIGGSLFYPFPSSLVHDPSALYTALEGALTGGQIAVLAVGFGLALHGVFLDIAQEGMGLFRPLAVLLFLVIVLFYPVHELRFMLPVLPILLFFVLRSATALAGRLLKPRSARVALGAGAAVLLLIPNAAAVTELIGTNANYVRDPEAFARRVSASGDPSPFYTRPWEQMGAWMTENVPHGSVIASPAKEIAPFVRGRSVLELSRSVPGPLFDRRLRDNAVDCLLATTVWADFRSYEFAMAESRRYHFEPIHSAGALTLFRVHRRFSAEGVASEGPALDTSDFSAPALLRLGRRHLLDLEYIQALGTLNEAARLAPMQAEITAQQILASSVLGDIESSRRLFEQLFTMPQSTAHISLAQAHLALAEQLNVASEASSADERSALAIGAGRSYWDLGYRSLALRVMQNVLRLDSSSFDAALWACHFARQVGDTSLSRRYLATLKDIDFTAAIITDLESIDAAGRELARLPSNAESVRLHIRLASVYEKLELVEEALDELERAQAVAPEDREVRQSMARLYERKGAFPALRRLAGG